MFIPTKMFLTKGVGIHRERLQSFEIALRKAGIEFINIVAVSSILPPRCEIISRDKGLRLLQPGQITCCVISSASSNEPRRQIAASIGVAIPADRDMYGYLSEHHNYGETADEAGEYAENLAASMLASTLGVEFDEDESWDNKRQIWTISGKIVRSRNITQSAEVGKDGKWKTVIAAAVLLP